MTKLVDNIFESLFRPNQEDLGYRFFRVMLYLVLLFQTLRLLPIADFVWGESSLMLETVYYPGSLSMLLDCINVFGLGKYYWIIVCIQLFALVFALVGRFPVANSIIIWWSTSNLYNRMYLMDNGGMDLAGILLFYMMLVQPKFAENSQGIGWLVSKLALWACKTQVVLVYAIAGGYKLFRSEWLDGEANFYILAHNHFSTPMLHGLAEVEWLVRLVTYAVLTYQVLFPVLVWFNGIKIPFLLIGVGIHLYIAFGMGLPDFGLIMIATYFLFLNDRHIKSIRRKLNQISYYLKKMLGITKHKVVDRSSFH